jgi:hypothetical protein
MISQTVRPESDRFNTDRPNLCPALRWKGQFVLAEHDPTVQRSNDGLFWCLHTQTCIGPDGELAEPGNCASSRRKCHSTGKCE